MCSEGMKVFITGMPGTGKSTLLLDIIGSLGKRGIAVGGFVTPEVRKGKARTGFLVRDLTSGEELLFAGRGLKAKETLGKYRIDVDTFEKVALKALQHAVEKCDVIAIDEIGKMELKSGKFRQLLGEILNSDKKVIAVLHRDYKESFGSFGKVYELTKDNRDAVAREIEGLFPGKA